MAALLGATPEQADDACAAAPDACWVANDNAPGQVVIAGTPDGVDAGSARAKELGVRRATALNVGGAFHTPLMADAAAGLAARSSPRSTLAAPAAPVVSNHDAVAYADADGWRDRLAEHVTVPVRWRSSMDTLVALGADHLRRGRARLDDRGARQARRARSVTVRNVASPRRHSPTILEVA